MSKILLITGIVFVAAGAWMFLVDLLPMDLLNQSSEGTYKKYVPTDSFSISSYKLHFLAIGIVLLLIYKFKNSLNL